MTIGYELKKILLKRYGILITLFALLIKITSLLWGNDAAVLNNKMEENKNIFLSYMQVLSGEINEEKSEFIVSEEKNFADAQSLYAQTEQQYLNGKCSEYDYLIALEDYEATQEKHEAFSVVQGQYLSATADNRRYFMYTNGWSRLLAGGAPDWILIFFVCIITAPVISKEYSCEMAQLLALTKNGKARLYISKLAAVLIVVTAVSVVFSMTEIVYTCLRYGLNNPDFPLKSIPQFVNTEYDLSVYQAMIVIFLNRLCGVWYLSALIFYISTIIKNTLPCIFIGLSVVFVPMLLLAESKMQYILPLPTGMFKPHAYLQSKFNAVYASNTVISISQNEYIRTIVIMVLITTLLSFANIMKFDIKKLRFSALCLCLLSVSGCNNADEYKMNNIYNSYNSILSASNEEYTIEITDQIPILYDKSSDESIKIIRNPFDETAIISCAAVYADDKAVYRLEQISASSINGNSIYTEQIVRTNLADFNEEIIYRDEILKDTSSSFLGLGKYLPLSDESSTDSIHSFAVFDNFIIILKESGLYLFSLENDKCELLADGYIRCWSCAYGFIYYIDSEYSLHKLDVKSKNDSVICDERISSMYVTENEIFAYSISRGNTLITKSLNAEEWSVV